MVTSVLHRWGAPRPRRARFPGADAVRRVLVGIAWLAAGCGDATAPATAPVSSGTAESRGNTPESRGGAAESMGSTPEGMGSTTDSMGGSPEGMGVTPENIAVAPVSMGGDTEQRASFGGSACRACLGEACASAISGCLAEPGCADRIDCLDACPPASDGSVDRACAEGCPSPGGTAETSAVSALDGCWAQAACTACGQAAMPAEPMPPAITTPLFSQQCTSQENESACTECELNRCCDSRATCENDPACVAYFSCVQQCPGSLPECVAACDEQGLTGYAVFAARVACITGRCTEQCTGEPVNPCQACIFGTCGDSYARCESSEVCSRLSLCVAECQDSECLSNCQARYPLGVSDLEAELQCQLQYCGNLCP